LRFGIFRTLADLGSGFGIAAAGGLLGLLLDFLKLLLGEFYSFSGK
jgi:hypothetical protein